MKTIYTNGRIYTMEDKALYDSMVVEDGIIGKLGNGLTPQGCEETVDLQGKTVLPAFIDAHSHITSVAMAMLQVDLRDCTSIAQIQQRLRDYARQPDAQALGYVSAVGYDHNRLAEQRHPTCAELDAAVPDLPVVLNHQSNHFGVFNSRAIALLQLNTQDGYLQETEFVAAVRKMPMPGIDSLLRCYEKAEQYYASYGITHVQDGMIVQEMVPIYTALLASDKLYLDIHGIASVQEKDSLCAALEHKNPHFTIDGYKVILDGSPQGKTAWTRKPYLGEGADCSAPLLTDDRLYDAFAAALQDNKPLLAHCNGDAAAAQFIRVAQRFDPQQIQNNRPVIIHAQLLGTDQLQAVQALGMIPSFFVAHVYYYGDVHVQNLGAERAAQISPAASAQRLGIPFTFHQDSPVIPPNMLETVWCSMARETQSGRVLGADEQIDVYSALQAVTIHAAKQYGLEACLGSLAVGKRADFVVLEQDVFQVPKAALKTLQVQKTYKDGKCIYSRETTEE